MKKLLLVASLLVATTAAMAQGTLNFNTRVVADGIDAKCFDVDGTTPLAGTDYLAQLYTGADAGSLGPVGTPIAFRTGSAAGWLNGGEVATSLALNGAGFAQVKAWKAADGASYEAAEAASGAIGASNIIPVTAGGGGNPPALAGNLIGLQAWSLTMTIIPEPSTIALGLLGAAVLFLRRRN